MSKQMVEEVVVGSILVVAGDMVWEVVVEVTGGVVEVAIESEMREWAMMAAKALP